MMGRAIRTFFLFVTALVFPLLTFAQCTPIVAIVSTHTHSEVVHQIEAALLSAEDVRPTLIHLEAKSLEPLHIPSELHMAHNVLYVTVGPKAFGSLLEAMPDAPILATLLYKYQFRDVLSSHRSHNNTYVPNASAVYLDQPFRRQVRFLHCLLPQEAIKKKVGVLLGEHSFASHHALKKIANETNVNMQIMQLSSNENPLSVLSTLMKSTHVLLAVPDNTIFNSHTARNILLTGTRQHQPVIAYSKSMVDIGALAALYSTGEQVAKQISHVVNDIVNCQPNHELPKPLYSEYFQVATNPTVANTIHLQLPDSWQIKYALDELENEQVNPRCYQQLTGT